MDLRTIDFQDPDAATQFISSLHDIGFAILTGHPVDSRVLALISSEWLAFFHSEAKHGYLHAPTSQQGYFPAPPPGTRLSDGQMRDRKEFFQVQADGPYPPQVSAVTRDYFQDAMRLAALLLGWLDLVPAAARAEGGSYASMLAGSTGSTLRIQHYLPPTGDEPPGSLRAIEHKDLNLITLLPAPTAPGLQVKMSAGGWLDVPGDDGVLVINAGGMLDHASGGFFPATPHRVLQQGPANLTGSRLSFPLFVHPRPDVNLGGGLTAQEFLAGQVAALARRGWAVAPGGAGTGG